MKHVEIVVNSGARYQGYLSADRADRICLTSLVILNKAGEVMATPKRKPANTRWFQRINVVSIQEVER